MHTVYTTLLIALALCACIRLRLPQLHAAGAKHAGAREHERMAALEGGLAVLFGIADAAFRLNLFGINGGIHERLG